MKEVRYAGFWIRFVASFADTFLLALPIAIVVYLISNGSWFDFAQYQQNIHAAMAGNASAAFNNSPQMSLKWELLFEFLVLIISAIFWRRYRGATPGKRFANIKVVDANTFEEIDNKQALTRSIGYLASTFTFLIGFLMVGFHKQKRGLHDLLANTVVIYDEINHN